MLLESDESGPEVEDDIKTRSCNIKPNEGENVQKRKIQNYMRGGRSTLTFVVLIERDFHTPIIG